MATFWPSTPAALCCLLLLTAFIGSAQSVSCCLKYSKRRFSFRHLTGYTVQSIYGSCDMPAIIFHLRGMFICANPATGFTRRAIKCVDRKKRGDHF